MSELALVVWTVFSATCGGLIVWMWMQLRLQEHRAVHAEEIQALQEQLWETRSRSARASVRMLAAESRNAWLTRYMRRLDQELELERIVSESYAAGIAKQER